MLSTTQEEQYRLGQEKLKYQRYEEAIECFEQVIKKKDSNYVEAWLFKGLAFNELKRYNAAINCFNEAINCFNGKSIDGATYMKSILAYIYYANGLSNSNLGGQEHLQKAISCFTHAINIEDNFAEAWHNKGIAYGNLRQYEKAADCFDKCLGIDQEFADAFRCKGFVLSKRNKYNEAYKCIESALKIKPHFAYAYNTKGYIILSDPEIEKKDAAIKAIKCFEDAILTDPNFVHAYYNKGYAYIVLGEYQKALESINRAIQIDPNNSYAWYYRGYAQLGLKKYKDAIVDFDKSIELDLNNADARNYKGLSIYLSSGSNKEAIECFDKAIEIAKIKPNDLKPDGSNDLTLPLAYYFKGCVLIHQRRYKDAKDNFNYAADFFSGMDEFQWKEFAAHARHYEGVADGYLGKYDEALECFEEAIEHFEKPLKNEDANKWYLDDKFRKNHLADIYRKKGFVLEKLGDSTEAKVFF